MEQMWNKFDMGTADKVCCVALGIKEQSEEKGCLVENIMGL